MKENEIQNMQEVLYKLFGDEKVRWFQSSDSYQRISGDTYISYRYDGGYKGAVIISVGGSNIDETPIKVCYTADQINKLVQAIIF